MTREEVIEHESSHASACLLLGIPIRRITAGHTEGCVTIGPGRCSARDYGIMVAAGWMAHGKVPDFPPRSDAYDGDERKLAAIVQALDWSDSDWNSLILDAWNFMARPEFERAEVAFKAGLSDRYVLEGEMLAAVISCVRQREVEEVVTDSLLRLEREKGKDVSIAA